MGDNNNNNGGAGGGAAKGHVGSAGGAAAQPGDLFGVWNLDVKTPFGQHPATLTLARGADGSAAGDIKSRLGDAALTGIELGGGRVEADISIRLQGRDFAARLFAEAAGGGMTGTIKVRDFAMAPALKFTGKKQ